MQQFPIRIFSNILVIRTIELISICVFLAHAFPFNVCRNKCYLVDSDNPVQSIQMLKDIFEKRSLILHIIEWRSIPSATAISIESISSILPSTKQMRKIGSYLTRHVKEF